MRFVTYPAAVDDALVEGPDVQRFAAAAGGRVLVATASEAFLFPWGDAGVNQEAGVRLIPPRGSASTAGNLVLAAWGRGGSQDPDAVGVAMVTSDGRLRVFPHGTPLPCAEVRVDTLLESTVGAMAAWSVDDRPVVVCFGDRGKAVRITVDEHERLKVDRVRHTLVPSARGLSGLLARAVGSGLGGADPGQDGYLGETVASIYLGASSLVTIRSAGLVEKWTILSPSTSPHRAGQADWHWNVAREVWSRRGGEVSYEVIDACGARDGRIAVLLAFSRPGENEAELLATWFELGPSARGSPILGESFSVGTTSASWRDQEEAIYFRESCGIFYVVVSKIGLVRWTSMSRGLAQEDQVQGEARNLWNPTEGNNNPIISVFDSSEGDSDTALRGGTIAILGSEGILFFSGGIPAPPDAAPIVPSEVHYDRADSKNSPENRVWVAFLQFEAGHLNSARSTLQSISGLVLQGDLHASHAFSAGVAAASERIANICSKESNTGQLLVTQSIASRRKRHQKLLQMVLTGGVLNEGNIWSLISKKSRYELIDHNEMISAAYELREVENSYNKGSDNPDMILGHSLLSETLQKVTESQGVQIYDQLNRIECVLPCLAMVLGEVVSRFREDSKNAKIYNLAIIISAGCEAMSAIIRGVLQSQAEILEVCANELMERRGGWSCTEKYITIFSEMRRYLAELYRDCGPGNSEVLEGLATEIIEFTLHALKMRGELTSRGDSLLSDFFQSFGLVDQCQELAFKFGLFETIMTLSVRTNFPTSFEDTIERGIQEFGHDFAMFAFNNLEQKRRLDLLMKRSKEEQKIILHQWLTDSEKPKHHLKWMNDLRCGAFSQAGREILRQCSTVAVTGREGSLSQTETLLSVAKLSFLRSKEEAMVDEVDSRLYFISAQKDIKTGAEEDSLWSHRKIIEQFILECPVLEEALRNRVSIALEMLSRSEASADERQELHDFIWRQCVGRESVKWANILNHCTGRDRVNDQNLHQLLIHTGFYLASRENSLSVEMLEAMIQRGVFDNIIPDHSRECEDADHASPHAPPTLVQLLRATASYVLETPMQVS
uniref:Nuclear pore complex protein NUP133 n=1 Tax=Compsopogon caeruleus TaxID=31354 RepID=A0A7S1T985_9RHOD|mmetsp:Transcript_13492/g.27571  ORF Transcript_13492/g.27571 Transcript_13492/m.27571 type:complete len:1065 (+) Transcript_13492:117-3311(+)|eukprot:CAMPEP_0184684414 /NCGR_PEP_ID=MMETSP0312-20130426/15183_1 /TAXON_ID=31354 /ORGANISM="Compsopogon coeruleus, Strain SAG 36.94" /LENGTH=1064 /DNA_ID=CAMNT_0027137557 /DNA_START=106 /DNA_END=3300 /DNA_ORIENTATION=+